ncbi:MAG: hypothetical protein ABH875_04505 [Candidatus Omnitrophota bacterium]
MGNRIFSKRKKYYWILALVSITILTIALHNNFGKRYAYRAIMDDTIVIDDKVKIDPTIPSFNQYFAWNISKSGKKPIFDRGDKIRLKLKTSNYMYPPKFCQKIAWLPGFVQEESNRRTYFYAYPIEGGFVGISYFNATADTIIKEDAIVEIEGVITSFEESNPVLPYSFWVEADKIVAQQAGS